MWLSGKSVEQNSITTNLKTGNILKYETSQKTSWPFLRLDVPCVLFQDFQNSVSHLLGKIQNFVIFCVSFLKQFLNRLT